MKENSKYKIETDRDGLIQITLCEDDLETLYFALNKYSEYLGSEKPDAYWKQHLQYSKNLEKKLENFLNKFFKR